MYECFCFCVCFRVFLHDVCLMWFVWFVVCVWSVLLSPFVCVCVCCVWCVCLFVFFCVFPLCSVRWCLCMWVI